MKRRTLDIMFSAGGAALAGLLLIVGLIMTSNATFSTDYVKKQLGQEGIKFKTADKLSPAEKAYTRANTGCLFTYAGQTITTGKQAECYANELIGGHLKDPNRIAGAKGRSYVELGAVQGDLRTRITEAQASNDPSLPALEKELADVTAGRETVFNGTMLRNSLLTVYGFSVLGDKAAQAARIAYAAAALLALLSIAGFVHAFVTPRDKPFAAVDPIGAEKIKVRAGV